MLTGVAGFTCTLVAVDFVDAPPVVAGSALAVVQVYLAIETCRLERMLAKDVKKNPQIFSARMC